MPESNSPYRTITESVGSEIENDFYKIERAYLYKKWVLWGCQTPGTQLYRCTKSTDSWSLQIEHQFVFILTRYIAYPSLHSWDNSPNIKCQRIVSENTNCHFMGNPSFHILTWVFWWIFYLWIWFIKRTIFMLLFN